MFCVVLAIAWTENFFSPTNWAPVSIDTNSYMCETRLQLQCQVTLLNQVQLRVTKIAGPKQNCVDKDVNPGFIVECAMHTTENGKKEITTTTILSKIRVGFYSGRWCCQSSPFGIEKKVHVKKKTDQIRVQRSKVYESKVVVRPPPFGWCCFFPLHFWVVLLSAPLPFRVVLPFPLSQI